MNEKEKAKELVDRFSYPDKINAPMTRDKQAKQCALICVDETIEALMELHQDVRTRSLLIYWQELKQEIKKL